MLHDGVVPDEIYFDYQQTPCSAEKSAVRWKRDLVLLLSEYAQS
ncbi:MAG: hypothetical protein ACRCXC_00625 [Legionella sp.]